MILRGGCHCGLVAFEASVPDGAPVVVSECDCSICTMTGYQHVIVPESRFRLVEGKSETTTYRFGTGKARHIFCQQCGIKSFYRPRSDPAAISLNWRCIEDRGAIEARIVPAGGS
ncbi:MAG: GFA family protein [Sphingomonas fennica]